MEFFIRLGMTNTTNTLTVTKMFTMIGLWIQTFKDATTESACVWEICDKMSASIFSPKIEGMVANISYYHFWKNENEVSS